MITEPRLIFKKKSLLLIIATISIPLLAIGTDILFHKTQHNQAITTPWTGIQIATMPFFVADESDYSIFETKEKQDYFKYVYEKIAQKKLLLKQVPELTDKIEFYTNNYALICNSTINENGEEFLSKKLSSEEKTILNDQITASMTVPLIKDNFKKWIGIYIRNIIKGFGSSMNLILFLTLLFLSTFTLIKKENNGSKFLIIGCLLTIGNIMLVSLAEPAMSRYVFYNNWVLIAIVLFLFQNTFLKKSNE